MKPAALLWPRSRAALAGSLAALVAAATRVALVPLVVLPLFDRVLVGEVEALPGVVALTGVVVVAGALALWAQDALFGAAAAALSARWRRRLYRRLLDRPPGTLPGSSGAMSSRILSDLREVELYLQYGLGSVVAESATTLGIVGYLVATDALATGLLLLFALPTALALRLVGGRIERSAEAVQVATEELGRHLQEGFRHHALIRAFRARALMLRRFEPANTAAERSASRRSLLAGLQVPLTQLLIFGAFVLLVLLLVDRVQQGSMSEGELVAFVTLVALLGTPLQLLPKALAMQQQARAAARRLLDLLGAPSAPGAPAHPAPTPSDVTYTLQGVTAGYDAVPVLHGIDLTLPARGLVVVRGESGAGKSSLLRLLLGFLPPSGGEVRFGGVPLDEIDPDALAERVGYVPQDSALLSGNLRENLLLGRDLPDASLWQALEGVGLAATVRALPRGLEHPLGEDGGGLSGGQQQRLAVARALLSDPTALLLDEPTANLDAESERALVATLESEARRRLVLAVAHRPALLEAADRTLTMSDGALSLRSIGDPVIYDDPDLYDAQYRSYRDDLPFYRRLADDQGGPVLELGAGTGRVTLALAAAGHRVVAIDRSSSMLRRARERLEAEGLADRVELIEGDMGALALPERFPLVVAPFNTLMHALTPADQDATLAGVRRQLAPGGAFGFDLFVPRHLGPSGVLRQEPTWRGVGGQDAELFLVQQHDEAAQLIESRYLLDRVVDGRLTRSARVLIQRYYTRFELMRALQQAGFGSIRIFGSFDRAPYDGDAPLMAGIAR